MALANTELLRTLPEYRSAVRRQRWLVAGGVALVGLLAVAAVLGAARPVQRATLVDQKDNRDIVLCLDVSGSMIDVDAAVVSTFRVSPRGSAGERIAMVIFNSSAVPVFPLTDDYDFVGEQLARPSGRSPSSTARTRSSPAPSTARAARSSATGWPPASAASTTRSCRGPGRSSSPPTTRRPASRCSPSPRAASWRRPPGHPGLRDEPSDNPSSSATVEMRQVVESTGGSYFALGDTNAVRRTLEAVTSREATRVPTAPRMVIHDVPGVPIVLAGLAVLGFLGIRRVRWRR